MIAKRIYNVLRSPDVRALAFNAAAAAAIAWLLAGRLSASASENLAFALLIVVAIASTLVAWTCAAMYALCMFMASSLDDFGDIVRAAVRASAPAMWLAAAIALLSALTPATTLLALLLIANIVRILVFRTLPMNLLTRRHRSRSGTPLSRYGRDRSFGRETLPAITGGFAIHAAAGAIWAGYPLMAAALVALSAAAFTVSARVRTPARPSVFGNPRRSAVGAIVAFVIAASISLDQARLNANGFAYNNALSESKLAWDRLAYGRQPQPPPAKQSATKLVSSPSAIVLPEKGLVPGVILRPDKPRAQTLVLPLSSRGGRFVSSTLVLRFTGEYHLFPTSSGQVQPDSVVYSGTPLDAVYRNVGGGAIETEAYQQLQPAIDFTNCERIRLTVKHGEVTPALASMELIGRDGIEELGSEVFGLERTSEETLEFAVPVSPRLGGVTAIRVGFRCDPSRRSESTKVAIVQFTLVPRSL